VLAGLPEEAGTGRGPEKPSFSKKPGFYAVGSVGNVSPFSRRRPTGAIIFPDFSAIAQPANGRPGFSSAVDTTGIRCVPGEFMPGQCASYSLWARQLRRWAQAKA
jgi:hypothetical protein